MPFCAKCKRKQPNYVYFSFPDDEELRKKWVDFLDIEGYKFTKRTALCVKHFTEDCIVIDGDKRYLKEGSIPSIYVSMNTQTKDKKGSLMKPKTSKKCILCGNNSKDLTYFPVPKSEELKQRWEKFCEFDFEDRIYSLCHLHFKPSVIQIVKGKRTLSPTAIPSIYFDDYQFEFIPVRKSNTEDDSNDAECMIVDPTVIINSDPNARKSNADSIISLDYTEYNTPPRTPNSNNTAFSKKTTVNSISDDIVNIFIPNYEDSMPSGDNSANNSTGAEAEQSASDISLRLTSNGKKRRMFYPGDIKTEDIISLDKAKTAIENFRHILDKKNKTIKLLRVRAKRWANKNAVLKETIRQLQAEKKAKEAKEKEDLFEVKGWWDS